jgi:hypothetical protein
MTPEEIELERQDYLKKAIGNMGNRGRSPSPIW